MMAFLIWLALAFLIGAYAHKNGKSFILWTLLAVFISPLLSGIILLIIVLITSDDPPNINTTR